jgi:hypothetical protein
LKKSINTQNANELQAFINFPENEKNENNFLVAKKCSTFF